MHFVDMDREKILIKDNYDFEYMISNITSDSILEIFVQKINGPDSLVDPTVNE